MKKKIKIAFLLISGIATGGVALTCMAHRVQQGQQESSLEVAVKQADTLTRQQAKLAKTHKLKGRTISDVDLLLAQEGFTCQLKLMALPSGAKPAAYVSSSGETPLYYCARAHRKDAANDPCKVEWAILELQMSRPFRLIEEVREAFATTTVGDEDYFCAISEALT